MGLSRLCGVILLFRISHNINPAALYPIVCPNNPSQYPLSLLEGSTPTSTPSWEPHVEFKPKYGLLDLQGLIYIPILLPFPVGVPNFFWYSNLFTWSLSQLQKLGFLGVGESGKKKLYISCIS